MFQHATITHRDRKMTMAFDGPAIEDNDQFENWHERIKVTVTHSTRNKRYEAHVSWCKAATRDNYAVEQHAIFTDPYELIMYSEPVGRFSESKFNAFCAEVQNRCLEVASDMNDTRDIANLLRKAAGFALVNS